MADKFEGDPSLRVLLTEDIATFPWSNDLFDIVQQVSLRGYDERTKQTEWLEKTCGQLTDVQVITGFCHTHNYSLDHTVVKCNRELLKQVCWKLNRYVLDQFIDQAFKQKCMEPMYLAAEIKLEDSQDSSVSCHFGEAVQLWGRKNRNVFPGLAYMVNERIKRIVARTERNGLPEMFEHLSLFFDRKIDGLTVTLSLRPPVTYRMPVVLAKFKQTEED